MNKNPSKANAEVLQAMNWMIRHFVWQAEQDDMQAEHSPELKHALDVQARLKNKTLVVTDTAGKRSYPKKYTMDKK